MIHAKLIAESERLCAECFPSRALLKEAIGRLAAALSASAPAPSAEPCAWYTPTGPCVHLNKSTIPAGITAIPLYASPPPVAPSGVEALRDALLAIASGVADHIKAGKIQCGSCQVNVDAAYAALAATQPKEPPK